MDSPRSADETMVLFSGVTELEAIPSWASIVPSRIHVRPDFLYNSASTLVKLLDLEVIEHDAPLVVIDVPNVSMQHGKGKVFSTSGLGMMIFIISNSRTVLESNGHSQYWFIVVVMLF